MEHTSKPGEPRHAPRRPLAHPIASNEWFDLVFHVLSLLPVADDDASSLSDESYTAWVERHWPRPAAEMTRTLVEDRQLLARLYRQRQGSHLLSALALLWQDVHHLRSTMASRLHEVAWRTERQTKLAGHLLEQLSPTLVELVRIALWSEAEAGYLELRRQQIEPLLETGLPALEQAFEQLAVLVPGLDSARLVAVHPLRRHGRVLWQDNEPTICVGLPHAELAVSTWAVVHQGCHEQVLATVTRGLAGNPLATTSSAPGYRYHLGPEIVALSVQARLFQQHRRDSFEQWLTTWLPASPAELASQLPWPVTGPATSDDLIDWLASSRAVPEHLAARHEMMLELFLPKMSPHRSGET